MKIISIALMLLFVRAPFSVSYPTETLRVQVGEDDAYRRMREIMHLDSVEEWLKRLISLNHKEVKKNTKSKSSDLVFTDQEERVLSILQEILSLDDTIGSEYSYVLLLLQWRQETFEKDAKVIIKFEDVKGKIEDFPIPHIDSSRLNLKIPNESLPNPVIKSGNTGSLVKTKMPRKIPEIVGHDNIPLQDEYYFLNNIHPLLFSTKKLQSLSIWVNGKEIIEVKHDGPSEIFDQNLKSVLEFVKIQSINL